MAKYDSVTKNGTCVFCEIVNGNIQTPGIFWEDEEFMAFLSTFPSVKGFSVVIPKAHFVFLVDFLILADRMVGIF